MLSVDWRLNRYWQEHQCHICYERECITLPYSTLVAGLESSQKERKLVCVCVVTVYMVEHILVCACVRVGDYRAVRAHGHMWEQGVQCSGLTSAFHHSDINNILSGTHILSLSFNLSFALRCMTLPACSRLAFSFCPSYTHPQVWALEFWLHEH